MTLFLGFVCICAMLRAELPDGIRRLSPFERAVAIIKRFEGWHSARHYPYIGFGHRLREGEKLTADITEAQAAARSWKDAQKYPDKEAGIR